MNTLIKTLTFSFAIGGALVQNSSELAAKPNTRKSTDKKPNIILFYVDDLGWMDLSCQGSKFYETPAIDKVAEEGIRFTQAYTSYPRCLPARYSLLTGTNPARAGIPGRRGASLMPEDVTVAEALQEGGYTTFFAGKWHLTGSDKQLMAKNMPENQGFDINIAGGKSGSPSTYFYPYRKGNKTEKGAKGFRIGQIHGLDEGGEHGEYLTDRLTDESVAFIEQHKKSNKDKPFFLYLSHYGVHTPFEAKKELIEKYEKKLQTMKYDLPEFKKVFGGGTTKLRQDLPVYAAMIESIDQSMDRINRTLKEQGIEDNTIIIFTADNGGMSTKGVNARVLGTSNYPLRNGKGWLHEGGIREAFIVKWPGITKAGSMSDALTVGSDIYPTLLDMAGLPLRPEIHLDGQSIVSAIKGRKLKRKRPVFWHSPVGRPSNTGDFNSSAIRDGDYKLIEWYDNEKIELYNIKEDIGEENNLVEQKPQMAKDLLTKLHNWRSEINAVIKKKK